MKKIIINIFSIETYNSSQEAIPYLIDTNSEDGLVIIDPGLHVKFIQEVEDYGLDPGKINHCLITHEHLDHFGGCYKLKESNENVRFYTHENAVKKIETKWEHDEIESRFPEYDYTPIKISKALKDGEILKFGNYKIKCIHVPGHTQGATAYYIESESVKILFGGDVAGTALKKGGGNINDYLTSMQRLIDFHAEVLCEGHSGVIRPQEAISEFIKRYMEFNENMHLAIEVDQTDIGAWYKTAFTLYELNEFDFALDFCNHLLELAPDNREAQILHEKIKAHDPVEVGFVKMALEREKNN